MTIAVVCPGCKKSFTVSEQFAGKEGPCPKCKTKIKIPAATEEIKVHAPEEYASGGKDSKGRPTAKPIPRRQRKLGTNAKLLITLSCLAVLFFTWLLGGKIQASAPMRLIGLLLITPPLAMAGYVFMRDENLEPHSGLGLWIRTAICSFIYIGLWVGFSYMPPEFMAEVWQWFFIAPPLLIIGSFVAFGCYDLEFGNAFLHYCFYLFATLMLRYLAGMDHLWANVV